MSSASPLLTRNFRELESVVAYHVKEDKVAQGNYETCHIGCLARGKEDPDFIKIEYGIPIIITRIQEAIFETLDPNEAVKFFASFPSAVACDGKDLTRVGWQFLASELRNLPEVESDIQAVIDPVIEGLDLLAAGKPWPEANSAARAAADAATRAAFDYDVEVSNLTAARAAVYAAHAARAAADAATRAAFDYDVEVSARAATRLDYAAGAAAQATHHVAAAAIQAALYTAAEAADTRLRQRDTLLKLISEAPVRGN